LLSKGSAFSQGPPINTDTAVISGIEGAALRSFFKYIEKSGDLEGGKSGRLSVVEVPIIIPYEIFPNKLLVVGKIPYTEKRRKVKDGVTEQRLSNSGFGDLSLNLKYLFYQKDAPRESTRAVLTGGIKLPTGEDNKKGLPPPLQDGSGSHDYNLGFIISRFKERIGMSADLVYTLKTEANDFEFGDTLKYDLALGYRLIPAVYETYPAKQLNLYIELNGTYAWKNEDNGVKVDDSGGNTIFLSPGIQLIPWRTLLFEASFQIPVFEDLNGKQLEPDYAIVVGFRWLIL
jgi:hypothetical protein